MHPLLTMRERATLRYLISVKTGTLFSAHPAVKPPFLTLPTGFLTSCISFGIAHATARLPFSFGEKPSDGEGRCGIRMAYKAALGYWGWVQGMISKNCRPGRTS
jgi:hypothetical protein